MTMTVTQAVITVGIVIAGTVFTRFIAYIAFPEGKKIPPFILYLGSVCSTKPLKKSRTALDTRGERLRCFEFDEMAGI